MLTFAVLGPSSAFTQEALSISELLRQVEQGRINDNEDNRQREERFRASKADQQRLLREAQAEKRAEERRSDQLENTFDANETKLGDLTALYNERLGALKELFGVMQQVAGDARGRFDSSLTNIQYPNRGVFLGDLAQKIGSSSQLPSVEEIERLWFELQREMTRNQENGRMVLDFMVEEIRNAGYKEFNEGNPVPINQAVVLILSLIHI